MFAGTDSVVELAKTSDIPEQYVHPQEKQCNYSYIHPSEKQCNYEPNLSDYITRDEISTLALSNVVAGNVSANSGTYRDTFSITFQSNFIFAILSSYAITSTSISYFDTIVIYNTSDIDRDPAPTGETFHSMSVGSKSISGRVSNGSSVVYMAVLTQ